MQHQKISKKIKSYYNRGITPKRVTSGAPLHSLAPGHHSSEETTQRWRAIGDTASDLTVLGIELQPPARQRYLNPKTDP